MLPTQHQLNNIKLDGASIHHYSLEIYVTILNYTMCICDLMTYPRILEMHVESIMFIYLVLTRIMLFINYYKLKNCLADLEYEKQKKYKKNLIIGFKHRVQYQLRKYVLENIRIKECMLKALCSLFSYEQG